MEFNAGDLRDWKKSEAGRPFWDALDQRFKDGISKMRHAVRSCDIHEAVINCTQADAAEEILQLVDALIEEQVIERKNAEKREGGKR